jgi:hypothetical protein
LWLDILENLVIYQDGCTAILRMGAMFLSRKQILHVNKDIGCTLMFLLGSLSRDKLKLLIPINGATLHGGLMNIQEGKW